MEKKFETVTTRQLRYLIRDVTGKLPSHGTIEKGIENGLPFREDRLTGRHAFIWDEVKEHLWPAGEVSSTRQSALEAAERDR